MVAILTKVSQNSVQNHAENACFCGLNHLSRSAQNSPIYIGLSITAKRACRFFASDKPIWFFTHVGKTWDQFPAPVGKPGIVITLTRVIALCQVNQPSRIPRKWLTNLLNTAERKLRLM
jgi:hypothetical protein